MGRKVILLSVAVGLSVVLSSCGSTTDDESGSAEVSVPVVTAQTAPDDAVADGSGTSEDAARPHEQTSGATDAQTEGPDVGAGPDPDSTVSEPEAAYGEDIGLACANIELARIRVQEDPAAVESAVGHRDEAVARVDASGDERFTDLVARLVGDPTTSAWNDGAVAFLAECEQAGYELL